MATPAAGGSIAPVLLTDEPFVATSQGQHSAAVADRAWDDIITDMAELGGEQFRMAQDGDIADRTFQHIAVGASF